MKLCTRCVIPANFPHVTFDENGICSLCKDALPEAERERLKKEYKARFDTLIKKRKRSPYDLLMCYSGGKDSTYTLKLLKEEYRLNILAYTFDNGFIPERTYINIRNVVEKLGVDHLFFKPRFDILKKIFTAALQKSLYPPKTLERASTVCTSCMGLVKYSSIRIAIEKNIPFIGFGWSPGQAPVTSSILTLNSTIVKAMEKVVKVPLEKIAGEAVNRYFPDEKQYAECSRFPVFVHPLAFFDYNEKKIVCTIQKLGWKKPAGVDFNATNCLLNSLADEAHIAECHFHPYVYEIAALVREGYMTRAEGLRHLPVKKDIRVIRLVKKRLGIRL